MMRPTTPIGSRTEKLTTSGPIGIEAPFISVTRPAKKSHLRGRDHGVAHHLAHRIAAIGGVDHGQFVGIVAQHLRDAPQDLGALERQHAPPFLERRGGRGDRGVDVGCAAIGDLAEDSRRYRADAVGIAAVLRLVPGAAVIGVAMLGQCQFLRNGGRRCDCGRHGLELRIGNPSKNGSRDASVAAGVCRDYFLSGTWISSASLLLGERRGDEFQSTPPRAAACRGP